MVAAVALTALALPAGSAGRSAWPDWLGLARAAVPSDDDGVHSGVGSTHGATRTRCALAATGILLVVGACSGGEVGSIVDALRQARSLPAATLGPKQVPEEGTMRLTSSAFEPGGVIPRRFTCDGPDVSPPLALADIPDGTASLVLVMDDPDAPGGTWDHWVAYDIPVRTEFAADSGSLGTAGRNSWGRSGYAGPCPPRGTHRYVFTVYAVDKRLGLGPGADKARVLEELAGHVMAEARLVGRYERTRG